MTDRIEITGERGGRRQMEVQGQRVVVGAGAQVGVRVDHPDLHDAELVLVRTTGGYRVESAEAGGLVVVNGEELLCKDLQPGDEIELGELRLRWHPDNAAPVVPAAAAPARRSARKAEPRPGSAAPTRRRVARPRGTPTWAVAGTAVVLAAALLMLAWRACGQTTWPRTPQHFIDLAREQHLRGSSEQALATLEFALREASGGALAEGQKLRQEIQAALHARSDLPALDRARVAAEAVLKFAEYYVPEGAGRPAARELMRQVEAWLQRHAAVCRRHESARPLLQRMEQLQARHAPVAAMAEPDTAADVLFAAEARLKYAVREYRAAAHLLDEWLAANAGDAEAGRVREARAALVRDGRDWLRGKLRLVDQLLDMGRRRDAERELQALDQRAVLPEWEDELAQRRQRIEQSKR